MLTALAARRRIDEPIAIVVAHPDDETLAVGGSMHLLRDVMLVHVTDGAPRSLDDAARAGFGSPAAYAAARRNELARALALSGSDPIEERFDIPDQEAIAHVDEIADRLRTLLRRNGIRTVLTHCYEGGHPDHDAVALAAHASCAETYEFAGYHAASGGGLSPGVFLPHDGAPTTEIILPTADLARKQAMLACFQSQSGMLGQFDPAVERFRRAPRYDFAAPPHPGRLLYEEWGWMTWAAWRARAAEARCVA